MYMMTMYAGLCVIYIICLVGVVRQISSQPVTLIDLSYEFSAKTPSYPGHTKFVSSNLKHVYPDPKSSVIRFAVQDLSGSEHAGTHMDAPMHFKDGGLTMEQIPIEAFTGPAVVISIEERARHDENSQVTLEDLENWEQKYGRIPKNAYVLMNSGWDKFWEDKKKYVGNDREDPSDCHYPGFSGEACKWLAENRQINGVGVDTAGLDIGISLTYPCHYVLSDNNIVILENVFNVAALPPSGATLRAYPMKIKGGTEAECALKPGGEVRRIRFKFERAPTRIIASINQRRSAHAENEL